MVVNAQGDWMTPLHMLESTELVEHCRSRSLDQKVRKPIPFACAALIKVEASARVNTSGKTSFRPIIGVMPTITLT
jgi:hypothetical protein